MLGLTGALWNSLSFQLQVLATKTAHKSRKHQKELQILLSSQIAKAPGYLQVPGKKINTYKYLASAKGDIFRDSQQLCFPGQAKWMLWPALAVTRALLIHWQSTKAKEVLILHREIC